MLSDKIKNYRTLQGLTREAFAGLVGKSFSTCTRWEKGECEPTYSDICAIAKALSVPISALFGEDDNDIQPTSQPTHKSADIVLTCGDISVRVPATEEGFNFAAKFLVKSASGEREEVKEDTTIQEAI